MSATGSSEQVVDTTTSTTPDAPRRVRMVFKRKVPLGRAEQVRGYFAKFYPSSAPVQRCPPAGDLLISQAPDQAKYEGCWSFTFETKEADTMFIWLMLLCPDFGGVGDG